MFNLLNLIKISFIKKEKCMNHKDLEQLQSFTAYPSISIFVRTYRTIPEKLQDPIKVKSAVGKAIELLSKDFSKQEVLPYAEALDRLAEGIDYTSTLDGLAFFVNKDFSGVYKLPFAVKDQVIIDKNFAIKDIVYGFNRNPLYWVLVVGKKLVRLFSGAATHITEMIDSPEDQKQEKGFPFKLDYDVTSDRKLQAVSAGDKDAGYLTNRQIRFMQEADDVLAKYVTDDVRPLIIIGTEEDIANFEKASKHSNLIVADIIDSLVDEDSNKIKEYAFEALQDFMQESSDLMVQEFQELRGKEPHSFGIEKIWTDAYNGKVRVLLVEQDYQVSGLVDKEEPYKITILDAHQATEQNVSDDLVDDLISLVLSKDGEVVFVKPQALKDVDHIAALLRY